MSPKLLYLCHKFLYGEYCHLWPVYFFENFEMGVVGNNVFSIGGDSTVYKLVVVYILLDESEMKISLLKLCGMQSGDGFHNVVGNLLAGLLRKDFLVLNQYFGIDA